MTNHRRAGTNASEYFVRSIEQKKNEGGGEAIEGKEIDHPPEGKLKNPGRVHSV